MNKNKNFWFSALIIGIIAIILQDKTAELVSLREVLSIMFAYACGSLIYDYGTYLYQIYKEHKLTNEQKNKIEELNNAIVKCEKAKEKLFKVYLEFNELTSKNNSHTIKHD